jgi:hypothetical protein
MKLNKARIRSQMRRAEDKIVKANDLIAILDKRIQDKRNSQ